LRAEHRNGAVANGSEEKQKPINKESKSLDRLQGFTFLTSFPMDELMGSVKAHQKADLKRAQSVVTLQF
jgi:hypothetical protein